MYCDLISVFLQLCSFLLLALLTCLVCQLLIKIIGYLFLVTLRIRLAGDIDKLNGCYYCRRLNNVHHPKAGGFVRGGDTFYKTVEDICGIKLNAEEKHLPM